MRTSSRPRRAAALTALTVGGAVLLAAPTAVAAPGGNGTVKEVYGSRGRPELRLITCGGTCDRRTGGSGNVVVFAHLARSVSRTGGPALAESGRPLSHRLDRGVRSRPVSSPGRAQSVNFRDSQAPYDPHGTFDRGAPAPK